RLLLRVALAGQRLVEAPVGSLTCRGPLEERDEPEPWIGDGEGVPRVGGDLCGGIGEHHRGDSLLVRKVAVGGCRGRAGGAGGGAQGGAANPGGGGPAVAAPRG